IIALEPTHRSETVRICERVGGRPPRLEYEVAPHQTVRLQVPVLAEQGRIRPPVLTRPKPPHRQRIACIVAYLHGESRFASLLDARRSRRPPWGIRRPTRVRDVVRERVKRQRLCVIRDRETT